MIELMHRADMYCSIGIQNYSIMDAHSKKYIPLESLTHSSFTYEFMKTRKKSPVSKGFRRNLSV